METHSASTTLDDIINELKLTYDRLIGFLEGEHVQNVPKGPVLLNLNKLLKNLSTQLETVENIDLGLLKSIKEQLGDEGSLDDESDEFLPLADLQAKNENNKKRSLAENDDKIADDEDFESDDDVKREIDDDEDDVSLAKRRKIANFSKKNEAGDENGRNSDFTPPEQRGQFTQDNDTRLKNPKSEYVSSQTLPAEAILELGLYDEENNGLETQGKEFLKKKYGVASYPENDLQDMLPGPIPNVDFSKNKPPSNQVQFTTFQTYIESYFRLFVPEDIDFLREKNIIPANFEKNYDPDVTPYIIPKLGKFYAELWAAEDPALAAKLNGPTYSHHHNFESYLPKGAIDGLTDEKLHTEEISCGALSSRLLSAIFNNNEEEGEFKGGEEMESNGSSKLSNEINEADDEDDNSMLDTYGNSEDVATRLNLTEPLKIDSEKSDFYSIEERLKRELKYIGIFMNLPDANGNSAAKRNSDNVGSGNFSSNGNPDIIDNDDWIKNREDDEVCEEIRMLQKELQEATASNRRKKKMLIPIVEDQIAYQEYCTILEDLDKQVDQAYIKRMRVKNRKKKSEQTPAQAQLQASVNTGLRALMEKRKKWINSIGRLFKAPELMKRPPKESVFEGGSDSEDEGEDVEVNDEGDLLKS